jgi:hypothetical protein
MSPTARCSAVRQGDQIGRIFVDWAIVYFGQFFEIYRTTPKFWATFFSDTSYLIICTENGFANILDNFLTNSSGHPATPVTNLEFTGYLQFS